MNIQRYKKSNEEIIILRINGGVDMTLLAKPIEKAFTVKPEKVNDFLNHKKNQNKLDVILNRAKKIEKNVGNKQ